MPALVVTPLIQNTSRSVLAECKITDEEKEAFVLLETEESAPLAVLQSLLQYSKELDDTPQYLHQLLKGSKPYHYIAPPKPRVCTCNCFVRLLTFKTGSGAGKKVSKAQSRDGKQTISENG